MPPHPRFPSSRRALLAWAATLGSGALAYTTNTLPAAVVDAKTQTVDVREVPHRFEIPANHVRDARRRAERFVEDATTAWSTAETSELSEADRSLARRALERAQETITDVGDGPGTVRTLRDCRSAAGDAGKVFGVARFVDGGVSGTYPDSSLADLRREVEAFRDDIVTECDDPTALVAHVGRAERYCERAASSLPDELAPGDAMAAGRLGKHLERSRCDLRDGRRIYRRYRASLSNPRPFGEQLAANRKRLERRARELKASYDERGVASLPNGSYRAARDRIASQAGFAGRRRLRDLDRNRRPDYEVLAAIDAAETLRYVLAWRDATNRIALDRTADRVPAKLLFRSKRDAVRTLRNAVSATDEESLARRWLTVARSRIDSGDRAFDRDESERSRAEAYAFYLLGWAHAENVRETANRLSAR